MKRFAFKRNLLWIFCVFFILFFITCEFFLRTCVKPSEDCYGTLFGKRLPPFKIKFSNKKNNQASWVDSIALTVGEQKLTNGDIFFISRKDSLLGYVSKENAISSNGWWQSNNVGARSRVNTSKEIPAGKKRVLVFGESYANCHGVPNEETWPYLLEEMTDHSMEVVNFGVEGYSMGQSLKRFEKINGTLDYDYVIFVFCPITDLPRDVNTLKPLMGWGGEDILPRFILKNGRLQWKQPPAEIAWGYNRDRSSALRQDVVDYLGKYDRFYGSVYKSTPILDHLISYKILNVMWFNLRMKWFHMTLMDKNSESMRITEKIFERADEIARKNDKKFILLIYPFRTNQYKKNFIYRKNWDNLTLVSFRKITCVDLMKYFLNYPNGHIDYAYDGTHYGPQSNRKIASIIKDKITALQLKTSDK